MLRSYSSITKDWIIHHTHSISGHFRKMLKGRDRTCVATGESARSRGAAHVLPRCKGGNIKKQGKLLESRGKGLD
jgi:hypothetical protein